MKKEIRKRAILFILILVPTAFILSKDNEETVKSVNSYINFEKYYNVKADSQDKDEIIVEKSINKVSDVEFLPASKVNESIELIPLLCK